MASILGLALGLSAIACSQGSSKDDTAAAGCAVLEAIISRGLVARVRKMGERFDQALKERLGEHPHVGDIRGRGLFRGVELVADRVTKTPFDPGKRLAANIKKAAFAQGLICYPTSGTRDGVNGDHILLAPPFILEDEHIEEIVTKLDASISSCLP